MKLAFFSLWDDEITELSSLQRRYIFESVRSREPLSQKNALLCECCDGVSVYGNDLIGEDLLRTLASYGVKFLSVRDEDTVVDYAAAQKYHIRVCRASYPPDAVAEFSVMLILIALRKYKQALWFQQVNDYSITHLKGKILAQQKVGVVGADDTAQRLAEILCGVGCEVYRYAGENFKNGESAGENVETGESRLPTYTDLEEIYASCDVIVYPSRLKDTEKYRVDGNVLKKMKDGVVLVNTASGELFDVPSIIEGVENKKIGVLAMDVFKGERGIYHEDRADDILRNRDMAYIRQFPNVILTQHMGFFTAYSMEKLIDRSVEGLVQLIRSGISEYEVISE